MSHKQAVAEQQQKTHRRGAPGKTKPVDENLSRHERRKLNAPIVSKLTKRATDWEIQNPVFGPFEPLISREEQVDETETPALPMYASSSIAEEEAWFADRDQDDSSSDFETIDLRVSYRQLDTPHRMYAVV